MADIFEEVEEAHRKDRVDELWQKFGWLVWLGAALIIIGVAISEYTGFQRAQQQEAQGAALEAAIEALDAAEYAVADAGFQDLTDARTPLSPLAGHYLAQVRLVGQGDRARAFEALTSAAASGDDPFADLARLKAAYLTADETSLGDLETALAPLTEQETALGALAQELVAAKAFAEGDYERARRDFNYLRFAPNAPPGLAQRAEIALSAIPRTADTEEAAAPSEPIETDTEPETETVATDESEEP